MTRWREERDCGSTNEQAVVRAVETAGRTVAVSGVTVAIGLLALVVLPVPGLRSVGIGGILIPLVSIAVVLTLLPAILGGIGPRVDWPRLRHEKQASRAWSRWASLIVRRRWFAVGVAVAALVVCILPVFDLKVGETGPQALSKTGPARVAYNQLVDSGLPAGALTPVEVLTKADATAGVAAKLAGVEGVSVLRSCRRARRSNGLWRSHRFTGARDGEQRHACACAGCAARTEERCRGGRPDRPRTDPARLFTCGVR